MVDVVDHQDANVYDHPPVYARLHFASGQEKVWDFRTTLTGQNGAFPPIWDFFKDGLSETRKGLELRKRNPHRVLVYGPVNPLEGKKALDEMERRLLSPGLDGMRRLV